MSSHSQDALLISLLREGDVSTFIDTFKLARVLSAPSDHALLQDVARSLSATEAARREGDAGATLSSLRRVGACFTEAGRHSLAAGYCARALTLARERGDAAGEAACLDEFAAAEEASGEDARAAALREEALALASAKGDAAAAADDCGHLLRIRTREGAAAEAAGDLPRALRFYQAALQAARAGGDEPGEAATCFALGRVILRGEGKGKNGAAGGGEALGIGAEAAVSYLKTNVRGSACVSSRGVCR